MTIKTCCALWLVCGLSAACGSRPHMGDNYGRQSRTFFARQHVRPTAVRGSPDGLDSEEAALIRATYKASLGGDNQRPEPDAASRVLLLQGQGNGSRSR